MIRNARDPRRLASIVAVAALLTLDAALANHFILPCGNDCDGPQLVVTGSMAEARELHTATLLDDGRVLVAGGRDASLRSLASAELYDPALGSWTPTESMTLPRSMHTATLLLDGRVLVAGGSGTAVAEIYDPVTGRWTATGSMGTTRGWFDAARLDDGRVLVAGGWGGPLDDVLRSAEVYDPATGLWTPTSNLSAKRYGHTLTLLPDGTVLAVRGTNSGDLMDALSGAERYDPRTGSWSYAGTTGASSVLHTATRLPDGRLLVVGGNGGGVGGDVVHAVTTVFDPVTGIWSRAPDVPGRRYDHAAIALSGGEVVVVGGTFQMGHYPTLRYGMHATTAQFDPDTMTWSAGAELPAARGRPSMTLLRDGSLLIAGGYAVEMRDDVSPPGIDVEVFASAARYFPTGARSKSGVPRKSGFEH